MLLLQDSDLLKFRNCGIPPYLDQMDDMFKGNTVDGSTSYVPGARWASQCHVVSSDEEAGEEAGEEQQHDVTPRSYGTKRASSTSTTGASPSKKSKSPAVRSMNAGLATHCEIARERLQFQKQVHLENRELQRRC
jgi:hypothetical protein